MKLNPIALAELVNIVVTGLATQTDVSQALRDLDLTFDPNDPSQSLLTLSDTYLARKKAEG